MCVPRAVWTGEKTHIWGRIMLVVVGSKACEHGRHPNEAGERMSSRGFFFWPGGEKFIFEIRNWKRGAEMGLFFDIAMSFANLEGII